MVKEELTSTTNLDGFLNLIEDYKKPIDSLEDRIKERVHELFNFVEKYDKIIIDLKNPEAVLTELISDEENRDLTKSDALLNKLIPEDKTIEDLTGPKVLLTELISEEIVAIKDALLDFMKGFLSFGNSFGLAKRGKVEKAIKKAVKELKKSNPHAIKKLIKSLDVLLAKIEGVDNDLAQELLSIVRRLKRKMLRLFKREQQKLQDEYYFNTIEENRNFSREMRKRLSLIHI